MTTELLSELRCRLSQILPPGYDDVMLEKWLTAREYNVDKAEKMYRESDAFKKKMSIGSIRANYQPPEVLQKYLAGGFCGFDKEGSPIRVELYGRLDMKGLMRSCRKSDLEKTKLHECEQTMIMWHKQSEKLGKRVDGLTVIFDMKNLGTKGLYGPGMQMYLHLVEVLENNYPEMVKQMFIINAPRIFPILWKVARAFISEDMKKKIHVLASDYKEHLLQYIDADQLPVFLGGTQVDSEDGGDRCLSKINFGGSVPSSYYLSETLVLDNMLTTVVNKGDKFVFDLVVDHPGAVIRWEFKTEDYDIGFGVSRSVEGETKQLVESRKVNSHKTLQDGSIICEHAGLYQLEFDNSYSWTNNKKLYYLVELHATDALTHAEVDGVSIGGKWGSMYCVSCDSIPSDLDKHSH